MPLTSFIKSLRCYQSERLKPSRWLEPNTPNANTNTMPDDKTKTRPQDASRVNVHEEYEVRYWTGKFGCTEAELRNAVKQVGTSAAAVEQHLRHRR